MNAMHVDCVYDRDCVATIIVVVFFVSIDKLRLCLIDATVMSYFTTADDYMVR
jgi:hypothetical protein